jgi:CheY-like chemotaxis protein
MLFEKSMQTAFAYRSLHILIIEDVEADVELTLLALESSGLYFTYDTTATAIECQKLLQNKIYVVCKCNVKVIGRMDV